MKLLADSCIYVNGAAAMRIHNLNAWVEVVCAQIIKEYPPGEQDMEAVLPDTVLFRGRDYFTSRVHEEIDAIMASFSLYRHQRPQPDWEGNGRISLAKS